MAYKNALAGLDLGGGKAVIIGDPAHGQERGAAARLRPVRPVARRPLLHRVRRRHLQRGHGHRGPRVLATSTGRTLGQRRRRRLLDPDRLRRVPGHAGRRRARLGRRRRCAAGGSASRAWARSATAWSDHLRRGRRRGRGLRRERAEAVERVARPHPRSRSWPTPQALTARRHRRLRPVRPRRGAGRRRPSPRLPPRIVCGGGQQPARPPGRREAARRPRDPLRARLRGQLRRRHPGRGRDRRASTSTGRKAKATQIFDTTLQDLRQRGGGGRPAGRRGRPAGRAQNVGSRR